jgi:hypothetical protein
VPAGVGTWPFAAGLLLVAAVIAPPAAHGVTEADLAIRATATSFRVGSTGTIGSVTNGGGANTTTPCGSVRRCPPARVRGRQRRVDLHDGGPLRSVHDGEHPAATTVTLELAVSVGGAAAPSVTTTFDLDYAGDPNLVNNSAARTTSVKPGTENPTRRR